MIEFDEPIINGVRYDEYGLVIEDEQYTTNIKHVSETVPGMPIPGEAKQSEIEDWLANQPDKFEAFDMTYTHLYFAERYIYRFGKDHKMDFIQDVYASWLKYERLTPGQAKGVLNVWRSHVLYDRRNAAKATAKATAKAEPNLYGTKLDLTGLQGYYADPLHMDDEADSRLKLRINKSKSNGVIYVNDGAVYGDGALYGIQKPGEFYTGKVAYVLERIIAEPLKSMQAYGFLTGRCGNCHRPLEDEMSVKRGFGPICWGKLVGD